jgi:DNA-binding MarR family transcriptional regulator
MPHKVDEKELKVIEEISKSSNLTQRELSVRSKLSLGAVNVILKRLVTRGFVKTKGLTPKKIEYGLTPKGLSEIAKKSYSYIQKTINLVKLIREEIAKIVLEEYNRGQRKFVIFGNDDLADIIELALKGFDYRRVERISDLDGKDALILIGRNKTKLGNGYRSVNIEEKLYDIYWGVE